MVLRDLLQSLRRGMNCCGLVLLAACGGGSETPAPLPEPNQSVLSASACTPQAVSAGEVQWRGTECLRAVPALRAPNSKRLSASNQPAITAYELLDWAELQYPQYFAPAKQFTQYSEPYFFRYYPGTGNYLGVAGSEVFVFGPLTDGKIARVGALEDFACPVANVGCPAPSVAEIAAKPVRIVFISSAEQLRSNGALIRAFADALAGDLKRRASLRSGYSGAHYSVEIFVAGQNAKAVRGQLVGYDAAMLIGAVPVPAVINWPDGNPAPLMHPFRLPACPLYEFEDDGNFLRPPPQVVEYDPACRRGMVVSVLRAPSGSNELTAVAEKLRQYISYHENSDAANRDWLPSFSYVNAFWGGSPSQYDQTMLATGWKQSTLNSFVDGYAAPEFKFDGTAEERKQAFLKCLGASGEVCQFSGHGNAGSILFEGPGIEGEYYSKDNLTLSWSDLKSHGPKAKFIGMQSCSSQNFLSENSTATALLFAGKVMLTEGASTTAFGSDSALMEGAQAVYPLLGLGGTFADAVRGSQRGDALSLQGDPFISFRPVPSVTPKLLIDGVRYHDVNFGYAIRFGESRRGEVSRKMLMLSNAGKVDLHVQLSWASKYFSLNDGDTPQGGYRGGFSIIDPQPIFGFDWGTGIGGRILTIKPNQSVRVTFQMEPWVNVETNERLIGEMSGSLEIFTTDPAAARISVDGRMRVH